MINSFKDLDLIKNLKISITTFEYFVDWKKVFKNKTDFEIILNELNFLLGKKDFDSNFKYLYNHNPNIITAIPILIATRGREIGVYNNITAESKLFNFAKNTNSDIDYIDFIKKSGLIEIFIDSGIKNLVDYVFGIEVGLDTHGRKNRGGKVMERLVENYIKKFCESNSYEYICQANAKKIIQKWSVEIKFDKSSRSFDFAIYNPKTKKIKLIETNFFGGGESKLKSVCGEFKDLYSSLLLQDIDLIWITDGFGWKTCLRPLEEVYYHNNKQIYNIDMLSNSILQTLNW